MPEESNIIEKEILKNVANAASAGREDIKKTGIFIKAMIDTVKNIKYPQSVEGGEVIANTILAYRHLEDAAMRLGKVIQAVEGGQSIYNTNDAKRVAENGPVEPGTYAENPDPTTMGVTGK